jgi:hypothetical protein
MSFESSFLVFVLVFLICSFLFHHQMRVVPRRKARLADRLARERFNAEIARIETLPKLATRYMMRVPENLLDKNPTQRSYGTRYNRLLVIDERGCAWVGLVIPEILASIITGEYIWCDYRIPFRGAGEALSGKPVCIDNVPIDIYPMWLTEGLNGYDWKLWAQIEKNFLECALNWNYQFGLGELNKHMENFRQKRAKFNGLADAAKIKVS